MMNNVKFFVNLYDYREFFYKVIYPFRLVQENDYFEGNILCSLEKLRD